MGNGRRRDRSRRNHEPCSSQVESAAGIFAHGIVRLRDAVRDSSGDSARSLRLIPDASEAGSHANISHAPGASAAHELAPA